MSHFTKFNNWYQELNKEQQRKFDFLLEVVRLRSMDKMGELNHKHWIRYHVTVPEYRTEKQFLKDELIRASEELTKIDLDCDWLDVYIELKLRKPPNKEIRFAPIHSKLWDLMTFSILSSSGLLSEYLNSDIDLNKNTPVDFDIKTLKDFDKVVELIGGMKWIVYFKKGSQNIRPPKTVEMTFKQLFRLEDQKEIPKQVLFYLGPGQADAWKEDDSGQKKWTYGQHLSSIIIPFHILNEMGYIKWPSRSKEKYIRTWLKEFGREIGPAENRKIYDSPPKDPVETSFITEYLNRIKKN